MRLLRLDATCGAGGEAVYFRMFTPANLLGALIFGTIGMGAFMWGKRKATIPPLVLGLLLMVYPYFVTETWLMYAVGALLTGGLFVWKEE